MESGPLRVLTNDGKVFVLKDVSVANDTVTGKTVDDPATLVSLPLDAVTGVQKKVSIESRENPNLGLLWLGLAAIGFFVGTTLAAN